MRKHPHNTIDYIVACIYTFGSSVMLAPVGHVACCYQPHTRNGNSNDAKSMLGIRSRTFSRNLSTWPKTGTRWAREILIRCVCCRSLGVRTWFPYSNIVLFLFAYHTFGRAVPQSRLPLRNQRRTARVERFIDFCIESTTLHTTHTILHTLYSCDVLSCRARSLHTPASMRGGPCGEIWCTAPKREHIRWTHNARLRPAPQRQR